MVPQIHFAHRNVREKSAAPSDNRGFLERSRSMEYPSTHLYSAAYAKLTFSHKGGRTLEAHKPIQLLLYAEVTETRYGGRCRMAVAAT